VPIAQVGVVIDPVGNAHRQALAALAGRVPQLALRRK
jgi:hypothetical protein